MPAMAEAGADLIEIGIPFSDPVAEGIVIQEADQRALAAGTTTDKIFDMVAPDPPKNRCAPGIYDIYQPHVCIRCG